MKSLKIGNLKLKNRLVLAPMVDITDLPYRLICKRAGAALVFTEMLYIDAILHENKKTLNLMKTVKEEKPVGLQITGNSGEEFEKFVKSKKWKDFELIDLNCGCPSIRITGNKAGGYLLRNPEKIRNMVGILKKTGKPVSVKIRLGFKKNNVLEVAREIERAGADALTVHARLAVDGRNVPADWSWISKVKKIVKIPVIGNGDVFSGENASRMLKICDGVMIARGAIGDPLIFSRILRYLGGEGDGKVNREKKSDEKIELSGKSRSELIGSSGLEEGDGLKNVNENLNLFLEYLRLEKKYYGNEIDIGRVKYLGSRFLRGFSGAGGKRDELMSLKTIGEIEGFARKI